MPGEVVCTCDAGVFLALGLTRGSGIALGSAGVSDARLRPEGDFTGVVAVELPLTFETGIAEAAAVVAVAAGGAAVLAGAAVAFALLVAGVAAGAVDVAVEAGAGVAEGAFAAAGAVIEAFGAGVEEVERPTFLGSVVPSVALVWTDAAGVGAGAGVATLAAGLGAAAGAGAAVPFSLGVVFSSASSSFLFTLDEVILMDLRSSRDLELLELVPLAATGAATRSREGSKGNFL